MSKEILGKTNERKPCTPHVPWFHGSRRGQVPSILEVFSKTVSGKTKGKPNEDNTSVYSKIQKSFGTKRL